MAKSFLTIKFVWLTLVTLVLWQGACSADCIKPIYPGENLWKIVKRIGECLDESSEAILSKLDIIDCAIQACEHPLFQTDMPYTITAPGTYCLAESVTNTGLNDFLITVSANNVILDLGGHVMDGGTQDGLAQGAQDGIVVYPGMRNIIIQNGTIANFAAHGINASASTNTLIQTPIEALTIKDILTIDMSSYLPGLSNTDQLDLVGSALDSLSAVPGFDPVLECCLGNEFNRVREAVGIFVDGANDVMIDNCQAFNIQGDGVYLRYVQEGIVKNSQSERNGGSGFVFDNCDVTSVQCCGAEQNGFNGFYEVACAGDNSYADCTAKQNGVHGFRVIGSGKTIERCIANQNTLDGFYVVTAQNSTVDGSLDITFDGDGTTLINFGGFDSANAVAIQEDGKIVSAGFTTSGGGAFALARQNSDGSLDTSFGVGGLVTITVPGATSTVLNAVAMQDDGKIVAAGYVIIAGISQFAVIRLHADGSLDLSFNVTGIVTYSFTGSDEQAIRLVLQQDGQIVVAGYTNASSTYEFALARFTTSGALDFSTTTAIGSSAQAYGLALQQNGKIVLGGFGILGSAQFALARYNTDGSLDSSFGVGGIVTTGFGNLGDQIGCLAIQKDGNIVAAGNTQTVSGLDIAAARYNVDGSLDSSFGVNGKVTTNVDYAEVSNAAVIQKDGKIIVTGYTQNNGGTIFKFMLVRYRTDGLLDTNFDGDGIVTTSVGGNSFGSSAALQKDGKIVVAGASSAFGNNDFALARYNIFKRSSVIQDSVALENGRDGFNVTDADKMTLLRNVASGNGCAGFIASAPFASNLDIIAKNVGSNNFCTNYSNIDAALVTVAGAWENITLN